MKPPRRTQSAGVTLVALALSLAGCPAPPPPAPVSPTPAATPRPARSPTPTPAPTLQRWKTSAVIGSLYHADGRVVGPDHRVRVRTGPAARTSFDQTVDTVEGRYGLIGVPSQEDLSFEVLLGGEVVVSRTVRFRGVEERPVVSFGGPATPEDPRAVQYPVP